MVSTPVGVDERAAVVRLAATVLAIVNTALLVVAVHEPARFGLSVGAALGLGVPHLLLESGIVAAPWRRLLRRPGHLWLLRGHVALNLAGLLAAMVLARGQGREVLWLVAMLLVYSSLVLPLTDQLAFVLVAVVGTVLTAAVVGELAAVVVDTIALTGVAALATMAARTIWGAVERQYEHRERAERAAAALRAVVGAARAGTTVDSQRILQAVTTAAGHLASDLAGLYAWCDDGRTLRYAATHRIPSHLTFERFEPDSGIVGTVLRAGRTVVIEDYPGYPSAIREYVDAGLLAAVGTPIEVDGEILGILVAGRYHPGGYTTEEVAAFELLAAHAGRALELSREVDEDRRALVRLRRLEQMKHDFVATVSHELRTPLTVITGIGETLERQHDRMPPDRQRDLLHRLNANATSLRQIISGLLDVAALDRGLVATESEVVDIAALARVCVDRMSPMLEDHEIVLDVPEAAHVRGDGPLIERVLDNLLVNAQRHTPAGTRVTVAIVEGPRYVEVAVVDDGPGIPAEIIDTILDRFVRGGDGNERRSRGLGLGLALADEVLRLHDSRLEVRSTPGTETRFSFALPLAAVPAPAPA